MILWSDPNMRLSSAKVILAVLPVALFSAALILTHGRGPYYFRNNFDPEYIYLLNSLSLLTLHAPAHTDHPGTTLQLLGAVVVWFQWLVRFLVVDRQPLSVSVLAHPEEYLRGINLLLNVLVGVALYWSAWSVYRRSGSLAAALLLQATVLIYLQTFLAITGVSPEPLLIATGLVLMVPMAQMVLGEGETAANGNRLAVAAGVIVGFGLITKITFAPLAAVILLFPRNSQKWRFGIAALAASIVFLLPVAVRFPTMASWFTSLLTHEGHYGTGRVGLPGAHELAANFLSLWRDEPLFFCFLGLYAAALVLLPPAAKRARPLLLAACLAILAETAMVVKHPSTHYLLPALILTAFVNAALWATLPRPVCMAVLLALAATGLAHNAWAIGVWTDSVRTDRRNLAELRAFEDTLTGCQIIGTYRSSQQIYALSFANDYSAAVHRETLEQVYPRAIHYDPFSHRFLSFAYQEMTGDVKRRVTSGQCILVEGTQLDPSVLKQLVTDGLRFTTLLTSADPISPSDATALYRLQPAGAP
jgi:hypothetical protein